MEFKHITNSKLDNQATRRLTGCWDEMAS